MLKIDAAGPSDGRITIRLEGRMLGPWVEELRRTCEAHLGEGRALTLDFSGVSFVDREGVALLRTLRQRQARLANCSAFLKELLNA
ncbi:MAG TPA: STAS domain-containing protein [Methylomirabilota bacterium]|nr:STAS domain-containing protein [Methylomirabilota bacterium]